MTIRDVWLLIARAGFTAYVGLSACNSTTTAENAGGSGGDQRGEGGAGQDTSNGGGGGTTALGTGGAGRNDGGNVGADGGTRPVSDAGTEAPPLSDAGFFGQPRCGASTFLFCDDFEGETFDTAKWTYYPPGANATGYAVIDKTRAARGSHSLHMHSGAQVHAAKPWTFLKDGFYLRAFMYWGQPIPDWHLTYFWATQPGVGAFTLGSYHGQLGMNEYGPNNGDTGVAAADNLPVGRWACIEWQVHPETNEVHVWMDDAEVPAEATNPFHVPNMHVTNWPPMPWTDFMIDFNPAQKNYDLWIDELAVSTTRIGCQR